MGRIAYDERSGLFFVNANEMPWILRLVKLGKPGEGGEPAGRRTYQAFCGTCHGENRQGSAADRAVARRHREPSVALQTA